jgi:hypothetical protein
MFNIKITQFVEDLRSGSDLGSIAPEQFQVVIALYFFLKDVRHMEPHLDLRFTSFFF